MKQKNYDVQDLYKDYMQSVSADPTAIDDILSGERQPANHGARIKHSTGKMATVTAAAAVVAICAGIGFSNMNANDDSSVKSAANKTATTTTAVTTAKQESSLAPAQQQADIKAEVTEMYASDHLLRIIYTISANTENGKELFNKAVEARNKTEAPLFVTRKDGKLTKNGFNVNNMDACKVNVDKYIITQEVCFVSADGAGTLNDGDTIDLTVNMFDTTTVPLKVTVKKNLTERVFSAQNGKKLWLTNAGLVCETDKKMSETNPNIIKLKFSDGKVITDDDEKLMSTGLSEDKNARMYQFGNMDTSKVTSVEYSGETFTPYEQAAVTMTAEPIFVTERAFGINLKLTADNEAGRKVLEENASKIVTSIKIEKDGMIATAGLLFGNDKLDGNTLNLRLYGNIFNKRIETVPVEIALPMETPYEVVKALGGNTSTTVFFKKTAEDKVFVNSATGEKFWLSDLVATTDHNYRTQKSPPVTFKLSDGTELTAFYGGGNFGRGKINKQHSFFLENKIDVSKVVSITYDGETFTAQ